MTQWAEKQTPPAKLSTWMAPRAFSLPGYSLWWAETSSNTSHHARALFQHWLLVGVGWRHPFLAEQGRSRVVHPLPPANLRIPQMRGRCSHVPCKASTGHSPKKAPRKEEKILAKWLLPKRMRKTHRKQGSPKSQSGSSTSRIGYLTLAVGIKRETKQALDAECIRLYVYEISDWFHIKVKGSPNSYLYAYGHQEKHFQYPQSGTMLAGKQRHSNCNWHFLMEQIWCNPWCYRKETSKGYRDCNCLLSPPAVPNQT